MIETVEMRLSNDEIIYTDLLNADTDGYDNVLLISGVFFEKSAIIIT